MYQNLIIVIPFLFFLIFCLINTALLRFAAEIVVRRMPSFAAAFWISVFSGLIFLFARLLTARLNALSGNSVLNQKDWLTDLRLPLNILPLLCFLIVVCVLSSKFFTDSESKVIGYGKGFAVTAVHFGFSLVLSVVFGAVLIFAVK